MADDAEKMPPPLEPTISGITDTPIGKCPQCGSRVSMPETRTVGLCRDCRWWREARNWTPSEPGWGACMLASGDDPDRRPLKARAQADYSAELQTLHDFGCIQHEAKG